MTSQIRLHIEYLIRTYNIFVLIFLIKIDEKVSLTEGFKHDLMMISESGLLFRATLYTCGQHDGT